jgi:catechol 2,3-dioxygenase-like lactoylglutathione lyase family enzyme
MMQIQYVSLQTTQVQALASFYLHTLGLPGKLQSEVLELQLPGTLLRFEQQKDSEKGAYYHFAFDIPENKMQEALPWLQARCEVICWQNLYIHDFVNWNAHSLYFFDPAGNIVELIARHDLPNARQAAFGSEQFLHVSEVGLVLPQGQLGAFYTALAEKTALPKYFGNLDNFCAAGSPEGLFILVPEGRAWFPVSVPAGIFPVEIHCKIPQAVSQELQWPHLPYCLKINQSENLLL